MTRLRYLVDLRGRLREALRNIAPTLAWFAKQQVLGGMPATTWKNLDRLPSPRMRGLSPAFDLIHTMQRVERTVRQFESDGAKELVEELGSLTAHLESAIKDNRARNTLLVRLVSDDRTGELTMESAARVLRCGTFPIRIPALPSYIAGHIVFSELRLIGEQFKRHGMSATLERAPSAAFVAQGVAALQSFIAMVRRRGRTCAAIAENLRALKRLDELLKPSHWQLHNALLLPAASAQRKLICARLASNLRLAAVSILGLRKVLSRAARDVDDADCSKPCDPRAWFKTDGKTKTDKAHRDGKQRAQAFVDSYVEALRKVCKPRESTRGLDDLTRLHATGSTQLVGTLAHSSRVRVWNANLEDAKRTGQLFAFEPSAISPDESAESRRDNALAAPWPLQLGAFEDKDKETWIDIREGVFKTAQSLAQKLAKPRAVQSKAFATAAHEYENAATELQFKLREQSRWVADLAERLLFGALTHATDRTDALELLSALWICDRTGQSWSEALEDRTAEAIARLQREDGSFKAGRPPVKWVHGFVMPAPSAATIGVLASLMDEPRHSDLPEQPGPEVHTRRLERWEAICIKSIEFLLSTRVGAHRDASELSGWHSDRQPEDGRIDLLTTCVAARALAAMDGVLAALINRLAFAGLNVEYPSRHKYDAAFALDSLSKDPKKDERPVLIDALRAVEWLSYHTRGFARDTTSPPPPLYRPRTTLYYGPPGTGKTYASKAIAAALGWPLVVVNPYHFLRDGDHFVGEVTAEIIERLNYASNCCIIFDECDQLIVDRNRQLFPSAFAMITATMLPLLDGLHESAERNNCLIAFATNFHALLDAAAIRRGRIDVKSCIVYPDYESRVLFLLLRKPHAVPGEIFRGAQRAALMSVGDFLKLDVLASDPKPQDWPPAAVGPSHYEGMWEKLKSVSGLQFNRPSGDSGTGAGTAELKRELARVIDCVGEWAQVPDSEQWAAVFGKAGIELPRKQPSEQGGDESHDKSRTTALAKGARPRVGAAGKSAEPPKVVPASPPLKSRRTVPMRRSHRSRRTP